MAGQADAMAMVRAGLCRRLEQLERAAQRRPDRSLAVGVAAIGSTAGEYGLAPLATLAHALGEALTAGARGHTVQLYLHAMRDAADCHRADPAAGQALLASVGLRLAG